MKKIEEHVLKILTQFGVDPQRACWDCRGTLVIYHRYLERIADRAGITFDDPDVKVLDMEKKLACMFVRGHLGENTAWSFGEVTPKNCTNDYPVAMAEKRAKDRVILKLAGLSGHVYSEEEADEFKASAPKRSATTEISLPKEPSAPVPAPVVVAAPARTIKQSGETPYGKAPMPPPAPVVRGEPVDEGVDPVDVVKGYLLQCGGEASRGSILKATGLTIGLFNGAVSRMRDSGEVALFGQKRGAKWKLLSGMTAAEGDPGPQAEAAPPLEAVPDLVQPEEPSVPQAGTLATDDMVREFTDGILNSGVNFIELANVTREFTGFPSVREAHTHSVMTVEAMDKIRSALAR